MESDAKFLKELKESTFEDHQLPWKPENRTNSDWRFAPKRTEWKIDLSKVGLGQLGPDILFKHPEDPVRDDQIWSVPGMAEDRNSAERARLEEPKLVDMTFDSIAQESKLWRKKLGLPENPDTQLLEKRKLPETDERYWRIIDGALAASVFNNKGEIKNFDDGEGYALLFIWLTFKDVNAKLATHAYENLIYRARYLKIKEDSGDEEVREVLQRKPDWGDVPFDKIRLVHTDDYGPMVNDGTAVVTTLIDTTGWPRRTAHFFLNGMVEEHGVAGFNANTWEASSFGLVTNFNSDIQENGLPDNVLSADTYWLTRPGIGFKVPRGSVLFVKEGTDTKQYSEAGLECITFDPAKSSLRLAIESYFKIHNLPFLSEITDTEALYDKYPRFDISSPSYPHSQGVDGGTENLLIHAKKAIAEGKRLSTTSVEKGQGNSHLGQDAEGLSALAEQAGLIFGISKKFAHACARENVREFCLEEYFSNEQDIGHLELLFKAGLI